MGPAVFTEWWNPGRPSLGTVDRQVHAFYGLF
jgi:hypothetical protein